MIRQGDAIEEMQTFPPQIVQTCITSPPYFGLRSYDGGEEEIGLEETPEEYVEKLVQVFREVHRVLRDNGTLWLVIGDSFQDKQLLGIPWKVAFALQADGWILRQDIIWAKTSCMPEPVKDRCTKSHEYIFLFAKNQKYYYDHEAIMTPQKQDWGTRDRANGKYNNEEVDRTMFRPAPETTRPQTNIRFGGNKYGDSDDPAHATKSGNYYEPTGWANKRDVWHIPTAQYKDAHFATFPEELVETCILAGTKEGDLVLDPFSGAGTTGVVAVKLLREYLGIELNRDYCEMSEKRIAEAAAQNRIFA